MAQSSPQKDRLPRGKANTYSVVPLSDTDAVAPLLSQLSIATCNPSVENDVKPASPVPEAVNTYVAAVSTRMSCACCAVEFSHRTEQRQHFKSDWHRYNLKLQLRGKAGIAEDQFEAMTADVSSISGSEDTSTSSAEEDKGAKRTAVPARLRQLRVHDSTDTTDSEGEDNSAIMAATRKHPKVFLRNGSGQLVSLYRCVLYHQKAPPNTPAELLALAEQARNHTRVAMVMLAGGHFSAAIFDGSEAVMHKTFHRYVVRAKRGTVQSVRDSQGGAPKSGGATLRRYNEAALTQEIQDLLSGWSRQLQACHLIFLRSSAHSRHVFFGGRAPLFGKDDQRVRTIPFTTARPTFNEAKRVHHTLMALECFGEESLVTDFVPVSPPRHLHPHTGQLVVRPDPDPSSRVMGRHKVKDRKGKGDPVEDVKGADRQEEMVNNEDEDDDDRSDVEVELVETMEEIRMDDLQEFACSFGGPKRQKKRKKKSGQKEKETTVTSHADLTADTEQLNEEDTQLKNRLYTCCKSGDATKLSQLLEPLTRRDAPNPASSSTHPHQYIPTTDSPCSDHPPTHTQPECPSPSAPQTCVSPHITHTHTAHHTTSATESLSQDCEEEKRELDNSEQGGNITNSVENPQPDDPHLSDTSTPSRELSAPNSSFSHDSSPISSRHIGRAEASPLEGGVGGAPSWQRLEGGVGGAPSWQRLEGVVMGRYGERGHSLLHVAAVSGHGDIVTVLLEAGCDPCARDGSGKTPYSVASTKDVRNTFRRFRGNYPHRYDYDSAQIPSALTADMETERKQREAEKKKQQKKAKQERLKERKAEELKAAREQKEKERFLGLSDREKRALAAERRFMAQATEQGATAVLNRCFQCGVDISGKVPFEYMEFQFCSPRCLKEHRMKGAKG